MVFFKHIVFIAVISILLVGCNLKMDDTSTNNSKRDTNFQDTFNENKSGPKYYQGIELPPSPLDPLTSKSARKNDGRNPLFPPGDGNM